MAVELPKHRGKVVGYRAWQLAGHELRSLVAGASWKPGPNRAVCSPPGDRRSANPPHDAPDPDCLCGLHAQHLPTTIPLTGFRHRPIFPDVVIGAVLAWGRLEVHAGGFRAQYAEPVVLAYSNQQPRQSVGRIQALGSEMGLRVVELRALEAVARELGEPVPEELRPARTRERLPMTLSPRPTRFADRLAPSGPRPYLKDHAMVPALYLGACIAVYITLLTRW